MSVTLLVEDVGKARKGIVAAAKQAGLPVLRVDPVAAPALDLFIETGEGFIDAARHLGAKVIYLALMETDKAESAEARQKILPLLRLAAQDDSEQVAFTRAVERMLDVSQQHGFPNFYAAFFHEGTLHRVHVCDRGAWPAVKEFQQRKEAWAEEGDEAEEDDWVGEALQELDEPVPTPPRSGRRGGKRKR